MLNLEIVGEGATTKIYRNGDTAIKLYVHASPDVAENEAKLQAFALGAGLPVPSVYGVRKLDEMTTALDMEYIPGVPLMQPRMDKEQRRDAIRLLAQMQCAVHAVSADGLPKQTDRLSWKFDRNPYLDPSVKDRLLTLLHSLADHSSRLCHGDFHPLNILYDGSRHVIIDWVDATSGNPLVDACRTYLIFKQFMSRSAGIYLRFFCEEADAKQEDILAWLPVVAAARMTENMDELARGWLKGIVGEWADKG